MPPTSLFGGPSQSTSEYGPASAHPREDVGIGLGPPSPSTGFILQSEYHHFLSKNSSIVLGILYAVLFIDLNLDAKAIHRDLEARLLHWRAHSCEENEFAASFYGRHNTSDLISAADIKGLCDYALTISKDLDWYILWEFTKGWAWPLSWRVELAKGVKRALSMTLERQTEMSTTLAKDQNSIDRRFQAWLSNRFEDCSETVASKYAKALFSGCTIDQLGKDSCTLNTFWYKSSKEVQLSYGLPEPLEEMAWLELQWEVALAILWAYLATAAQEQRRQRRQELLLARLQKWRQRVCHKISYDEEQAATLKSLFSDDTLTKMLKDPLAIDVGVLKERFWIHPKRLDNPYATNSGVLEKNAEGWIWARLFSKELLAAYKAALGPVEQEVRQMEAKEAKPFPMTEAEISAATDDATFILHRELW